MLTVSLATAMILGLSVVAQTVVFWRFASIFQHPRPSPPPGRLLPKVAVVLPVRHGDKQLTTAIGSVLRQNYANLQLVVIVDDVTDPAYEIARRAIPSPDSGRARVLFLKNRRQECGLVCSSLLQALDELDDDTQVITFAAADTVLPSTWVTELLATLNQPGVGATLGNRWYRLRSNNLGDVIQFLWNAGAVIPMWLFSIPWAGAIALRRSDIDATGLRKIWGTTIVEDTPVARAMLEHGKQMSFSPQLFVGINEAIGLRSCIQFICRQMLWTRLYHPRWTGISVSVIAGALAVWVPVLMLLYAIGRSEWTAAGILAGVVAGYLAVLLFLVTKLNAMVGGIFRARGEPETTLSVGRLFVLLVSIPLAQLVSLYSVAAANLATHVWWSGICYRLEKDGRVIMKDPLRD